MLMKHGSVIIRVEYFICMVVGRLTGAGGP